MTEKWKQEIIEEGKKKMGKLLVPRPSPGTLSTRMFEFVDWFGNKALDQAEQRFKTEVQELKCLLTSYQVEQNRNHGEIKRQDKEIARLNAENKQLRKIHPSTSLRIDKETKA